MAHQGLPEAELLSYIDESAKPFNLTADGVIALSQCGVPSRVISAMLARDGVFRGRRGRK